MKKKRRTCTFFDCTNLLPASSDVSFRCCETCRARVRRIEYEDGDAARLTEKQRTREVRKRRPSPYPGVYWMEYQQRWRASFLHNGAQFYVGSFMTAEEAKDKREEKLLQVKGTNANVSNQEAVHGKDN